MVGGESLGCRTCKKRRIKCDERRPTCFNCERSKRYCSGPEDRFKYHYGCKKQRELLIAALKPNEELFDRPSRIYTVTAQARGLRWIEDNFSKSLQKNPALTNADRIRSNLVYALEHPNRWFPLQSLGTYFVALPGRIGMNWALDTALDCFISTYRAYDGTTWHRDPHPAELATYGTALRALRKEIATTMAPDSAELMCAALLMATHEFYLRKPSFAIVTLARGVTSIVKDWGPSRFSDKFEMAMFSSHLAIIIKHNIIFGSDCFLDSGDWDCLLQKCGGSRPAGQNLWIIMARIAALLEDVRMVQSHSTERSPAVIKTALLLQEQIRQLRKIADEGLDSAGVYYLIPSLYRGPMPVPPPSPEDKRDAQKIVEHASYACAALIMVDGAIKRLRPDMSYDSELRETTSFILGTIPAANVCEHLYFNFVGLTAFGLVDDRGKRSIMDALIRNIRLKDKSELYDVLYRQFQTIYDAMTGGPVLPPEAC